MRWKQIHPQATQDHLEFIPIFLAPLDPRPAKEQIAERYVGGWNSFSGFGMLPDGNMKYPGDPRTRLLWETKLRDETIRVYESAWVAIVQPDGSFDVARLD